MLDRKDILKTQHMIDEQHLDIRTITMVVHNQNTLIYLLVDGVILHKE